MFVCAGPFLAEGAAGRRAGRRTAAVPPGRAGPAATLLAAEAEPVAWPASARGRPTTRSCSTPRAPPASPRARCCPTSRWCSTPSSRPAASCRCATTTCSWAVLPLFHSFGQTCVMNAGFVDRRHPGPDAAVRAGRGRSSLMVEHGSRSSRACPRCTSRCSTRRSADQRRPPLRTAISGGASLPVTVIEAFREVFGVDIYEGYGLSRDRARRDVQPAGLRAQGRAPSAARSGASTSGSPGRRSRSRIELLPTGELGEIVIRGHNLMKRYHNKPEATEAAIVDGWFRSGDLGTNDARRLRHDRRPQEGHGAAGRLQRLSARGRGGAAAAPGRSLRSPSSPCPTRTTARRSARS